MVSGVFSHLSVKSRGIPQPFALVFRFTWRYILSALDRMYPPSGECPGKKDGVYMNIGNRY